MKKNPISVCSAIMLPVLLIGLVVIVRTGSQMQAQAAPSSQAVHFSRVCGNALPGFARCHAFLLKSSLQRNNGIIPAATTPSGYKPADLQSAYKLPSQSAGSGQTVAIVDAFDDPTAEADLAVYRTQFGLSACTTTNGCFKKVNQTGGSKPPKKDASWSQEISLDLDMVSAICPKCHILLVEADDASIINLGIAVNAAVKLGANAVSNSYGGSEYQGEDSDDTKYFKHPGVAITASAGDGGYGLDFPAASQYVTAVGGTSLKKANNGRGWSETVWSSTGSGCSAYISKPAWQKDTGCSKRADADVAAVADPNTGVAVYDSYAYQGVSGWLTFGGTSASAPIIASVYALAGNESKITYGSYLYSHSSSLFDVTSGSNGTCNGSYLCTGKLGFDGPTGLGTPNGTAAF